MLTQMFACVRYIDTHHSPGTFPDQPVPPSQNEKDSSTATAPADAPQEPDSPELFQSRLQELATDLVRKEQQIEALISVLPGVGSSSSKQEQRMRELDRELRAVEGERVEALKEKEALLRSVDQVIVGIRRP